MEDAEGISNPNVGGKLWGGGGLLVLEGTKGDILKEASKRERQVPESTTDKGSREIYQLSYLLQAFAHLSPIKKRKIPFNMMQV